MTKRNILIVDDEPTQCKVLKKFITNMGHNLLIMNSGIEVIDFFVNKTIVEGFTAYDIDVMLLDLSMPDIDGLQVLKKIEKIKDAVQVIVLTASEDVSLAVSAINLGAIDYIIKGKDDLFARLTASINNAIDKKNLKYQVSNLVRRDQNQVAFYDIMGQSELLVSSLDLARRAINLSVPILIKGEEGSGKELLARAIHGSGSRSGKSFIVVECDMLSNNSALEEIFGSQRAGIENNGKSGKFRDAEGGTIFFKKIDALPSEIQIRLLRFLQDGEFYFADSSKPTRANVRLIASTAKDLSRLVAERRFREDLRYAISIFPITLPSLRDRGDKEIMILAQHFCRIFSVNENKKVKSISEAAQELLCNYFWKDNIRQLKNYIFRAVVLCDGETLEPEHFPQLLNIANHENIARKDQLIAKKRMIDVENIEIINIFDDEGKCKPLVEIEEEIAHKLMTKFSNNISEVAKQLNIARSTLYRKLRIEEENN